MFTIDPRQRSAASLHLVAGVAALLAGCSGPPGVDLAAGDGLAAADSDGGLPADGGSQGDGGTPADARIMPPLAARFAPAPVSWTVPRAGIGTGFWAPAWQVDSEAWTTIDIDGDGKPDLLHTADPGGARSVWGGDGDASWKVYLAQP